MTRVGISASIAWAVFALAFLDHRTALVGLAVVSGAILALFAHYLMEPRND